MVDLERAREALRPEADEARVQRVWTEVVRRRRAPRAPNGRRTLALAVLVGLTILGIAGSVWDAEPSDRVAISPELRLVNDAPLPDRLRGEVRLSDASRVVVDEDARLDVLANDTRALGLALRRGRARFEVTPGGPRSWNVDAGAVSVQVVGTVFEVARSREGVAVSVERGAVLVRGASVPDRVQRLEAGQRLFVPSDAAPDPLVTSTSDSTEDHARDDIDDALDDALDGAHEPQPTREAPWRAELAQRRYDRAFEALGIDGHARETRRARDVAALWELADVARFSGHPSEAAVPLRRLVEEHPNDPRAALAAYTLGRLELDVLGAPHAAAESFARSEALGLPEALREAAAASRVEALGRAGRRDDARVAAERYVIRHPEGARRVQVERWLTP